MSLESAQRRIKELEARLSQYESSKSEYVIGHASTMPDKEYQLSLFPFINRAPKLQASSGVYTRIENGYSFQSYRDISIRGQQLASALQSIHIGLGDVIGTFMYNNGKHFLIHYAAACAGIVLNALNFRLSSEDLVYIINHVGSKVIFVDALLLPEFQKIALHKLNKVKTIIVCGFNESNQLPLGWNTKLSNNFPLVLDFDTFISRGRSTFKWPNLHESTGLNLCFTSGTTGKPKGVLTSHRSACVHLMAMSTTDFISIRGTDCWLPLAPMYVVCYSYIFRNIYLRIIITS